ncbi:MAG: hypothetical protein Q7S39_02790 [Ignavibacteria bacterium]|nr:hypothetical protein [Ignavibacteria bacterium]
MKIYKDEIEGLKLELTDIQNEIQTIQFLIKQCFFDIDQMLVEQQKKFADEETRKRLGLHIANDESKIKIFESIVYRLRKEESRLFDRLIICSWYYNVRQIIKTKKMNGDFYSSSDENEYTIYDRVGMKLKS